jgi:nucleoid DNA-binding protein
MNSKEKKYAGLNVLARKYVELNGGSLEEAKDKVKDSVQILLSTIIDPKYSGVSFIGDFTIEKVKRAPRKGRNLQDDTPVDIPAKMDLKISVGKNLAKVLNP